MRANTNASDLGTLDEPPDAEPDAAPNPFAKVDAETAYLRGQVEKRDSRIKELEAKINLYEEYQRQKTIGMHHAWKRARVLFIGAPGSDLSPPPPFFL